MRSILVVVYLVSVAASVQSRLNSADPVKHPNETALAVKEFEQESDEKISSTHLRSAETKTGCTKPKILCIIAGGKCIKTGDKCKGTIDPSGCIGKKCQCCIPPTPIGCPSSEGFFYAPGTGNSQCLKYERHQTNWTNAVEVCKSQGLVLARPFNARALAMYMFEKYAHWWYWLDARGDGNEFWWQTDRTGADYVGKDSPLWFEGQPGSNVDETYCLFFLASPNVLANPQPRPYKALKCEADTPYPLCERILGP